LPFLHPPNPPVDVEGLVSFFSPGVGVGPLVNFGGPPEVPVPGPLWIPLVLGLSAVLQSEVVAFVSGFLVVLHPSSVVVVSAGLLSVVSFFELKNFLGPDSVLSLVSSFLASDLANPPVGPEGLSLLEKPGVFFSSAIIKLEYLRKKNYLVFHLLFGIQ